MDCEAQRLVPQEDARSDNTWKTLGLACSLAALLCLGVSTATPGPASLLTTARIVAPATVVTSRNGINRPGAAQHFRAARPVVLGRASATPGAEETAAPVVRADVSAEESAATEYLQPTYLNVETETNAIKGWSLVGGLFFSAAALVSAFVHRLAQPEPASRQAMALFSGGGRAPQGTKVLKKAPKAAPKKAAPKKAAPKKAAPKKAAPARKPTPPRRAATPPRRTPTRSAAKSQELVWFPNAVVPAYLDGSMPGDRGFDPLGLSAPKEYLQVDVDSLDQNLDNNRAGGVLGKFQPRKQEVSTDRLAPYNEVFEIDRFRECELIHGRWCMLAALGIISAEAVTGIPWQQVGLYEVQNGASYFGFDLPFSNTALVWIEVLAMGGVEVYRNTELDPEKRCYPGGNFDFLNLTDKDPEEVFRLKTAEIKHARVAMIALLGFGLQALVKPEEGALEALGTLFN